MIPKIIHYCWFGGKEKPKCVLKMINSWKKHCPDYEIKEWNELNFDISINQYCKEAYQSGKWAFVSDVARLYALHTEGGIYLDTDVELIKPLDEFLNQKAFTGFEGTEWIGTNIIGTEKGNRVIEEFFSLYNDITFINYDGTLNTTTNVERLTALLEKNYNLIKNGNTQDLDCIKIFSTEYFCPYDYINGVLNCTSNTHSIHWYSQSWIKRNSIERKIKQFYHRILGIKLK